MFLAAVLEREVAARNASGAAQRIRWAGFPGRKTLDDFDWDHQSAVRQQVASLASGAFLTEGRNVVLLGPPGTGKTHLATGLAVIAAHHGFGSCSPPPSIGSPDSTPTASAGSPLSSHGSAAMD